MRRADIFLQGETSCRLKYVLISQGLGRLHFIVLCRISAVFFVPQILRFHTVRLHVLICLSLYVDRPWSFIWQDSGWISTNGRTLLEMKATSAQLY